MGTVLSVATPFGLGAGPPYNSERSLFQALGLTGGRWESTRRSIMFGSSDRTSRLIPTCPPRRVMRTLISLEPEAGDVGILELSLVR